MVGEVGLERRRLPHTNLVQPTALGVLIPTVSVDQSD